VTTNSEYDYLVEAYLDELDAALAELPIAQRRQLIESIAEHVQEARSTLAIESESQVREILDRVGRPDEIAASAFEDFEMASVVQPRRFRRVLVVALAAAVLLAIGFSSYLTFHNDTSTPTSVATTSTLIASAAARVTVPNVIGLSLTDAEKELADVNLAFAISDTKNTPQACTVASEKPAPGTRIATDSFVTLVVDKSGTNCQ
jgi:hypothetical protein